MVLVHNIKEGATFNFPVIILKHDLYQMEGNLNISSSYDDLMDTDNILIINEINEEKEALINLPFSSRLILCVFMSMSLLVGSFFKGIMYSYVFTTNKNNRGWMHRPINVLTVTSAIIHHVSHISCGICYVVILLTDTPLGDVLGNHYCEIMDIIGIYGLTYLNVGSLGIAVYRILYVRHERWVKYVVGERLLLTIVLVLSLTSTGIIAFLFKIGRSNHRSHMNLCSGLSFTASQILIEYDLSQGMDMLVTPLFQSTAIGLAIILQTIEFSIYIWFFWNKYKNDNGNIRKLLSEDVTRKRNLKNVSTFLGQFYGFMGEYAFLVAIIILTSFTKEQKELIRALAVMIKFMDFGLLSAVEVLRSQTHRSSLRSTNTINHKINE